MGNSRFIKNSPDGTETRPFVETNHGHLCVQINPPRVQSIRR
jgi:hypothetical protein